MLPPIKSILLSDGFGSTRISPHVLILEVKRSAPDAEQTVAEWVLVERREVAEPDPRTGEIHQAKLCIYYWDLSGRGDANDVPSGNFSGSYSATCGVVSLTASALDTGGYVLIEPCRLRSARLGTYLMNSVVAWAKQWPDARVREIKLLASDANGENRSRRNRFYRQFGIEFDFADDSESAGLSRPMLASALTTTSSWQRSITEHDLVTHLRHATSTTTTLQSELRFVKGELKDASHELRHAYQHPFRWLFKRVIIDDLPRTAVALAIVLLAILAYFRLP